MIEELGPIFAGSIGTVIPAGGRLPMDQAVDDVMAEMSVLSWERADDLVEYFERSRSREAAPPA